ncbi:hypothetical protein [Cupriavidus pampae]|uniref:Uncharacterized protein n=1 Tax=Cupriavidus pampae TaxID=659251 RepID=A0ABN7Z5D7_9BURK|nr:hypothetical protein [Cupriavidus pampae]CAG9180428.1 hypothetical protein LMG32289_04618 [Cupriavidus pampae]
MEQLIRVQNEYDRQVLGWLRVRVGDAALQSAARKAATEGEKPYLSTVCRTLGLRPPTRRAFRDEAARMHRAVGERHLARIRQILGAAAQTSTVGASHPVQTRSGMNHRLPSRLQGSLF